MREASFFQLQTNLCRTHIQVIKSQLWGYKKTTLTSPEYNLALGSLFDMGFMKEFLSLEGGAPRFMRAGATTSFWPEKHCLAHVRRAYGCLQEEPDISSTAKVWIQQPLAIQDG